jgi:hypothetical protein
VLKRKRYPDNQPHLRKWHEARNTGVLQSGFPLELVQEQVPQPRHGYFVDMVFDARERLPVALEPLRRFVEGRRIVVEFESGAISAAKLRRHLAQPLLVPPPEDPDEAVLLVICRQPPEALLAFHDAVLLEPGLWQIPRGRRGAAYIVVPGLLEAKPGYALLRILFASRGKEDAKDRMGHLLTDPRLPSDILRQLLRRIRSQEVPMTVEEQGELNHTVYLHSLLRRIARQRMARARRQAEAQAREEDRQEGRQEGEQSEQRTLLSVASRIVSPSELERLGKLRLEQLRVEVEARIDALAGQQRQG